MANWMDVIDLISIVDDKDDDGFPTEKKQVKAGIFANKKSIYSSEYYLAKQNGIKLTYMFEIRSFEYDGQERLRYQDEEYRVERTYDRGEFIELTCKRESDDHA